MHKWALKEQLRVMGVKDDGESINYQYEKARLTRAQADAQEVKNLKVREDLVHKDVLIRILIEVANQAKSIFGSIPTQVKRKNPDLRSSTIEDIKKEVVKIQNAFTDIYQEIDYSKFNIDDDK